MNPGKEQTKMPRFKLEGPRPYTIFCFTFIHFPRSVVNNYCVLCAVMAKKENKNIEIQQRTLTSFITIPIH